MRLPLYRLDRAQRLKDYCARLSSRGYALYLFLKKPEMFALGDSLVIVHVKPEEIHIC